MINVNLPIGTFYRPCAGIFTADYNVPSVGQYDWNVAANTGVQLLSLSPNNLYMLSTLNFSATIPEANYLENVDTIPSLDLRLKLAGAQLNGQGYPLVTYMQNNEIAIFFWTNQKEDFLTANFRGVLNQNAALAAVASITAQVSLNIHEITDAAYIAKFKGLLQNDDRNSMAIPSKFKERV